MTGLTGIDPEQFVHATRGAISALRNAGADAKVFDMVMGIEYQTRNQWTSGRRPAKKPYVYYAILEFVRTVSVLAETDSFRVDPDMPKADRRKLHARIIRDYIGRGG
jgi:hypothetical protein